MLKESGEKLLISLVFITIILTLLFFVSITFNDRIGELEDDLILKNAQIKGIKTELENEQAKNEFYRSLIEKLINYNNKEITEKTEPSDTLHETTSYSDNSLYLLAQIVYSEANGEPFEGMIAVANVVMNRVESDKFPNTIKDVIYQKGQFQPVSNGKINNVPSEKAIDAAKVAMEGNSNTNALFFYNPTIATDKWIRTLTVSKVIGRHVFAN